MNKQSSTTPVGARFIAPGFIPSNNTPGFIPSNNAPRFTSPTTNTPASIVPADLSSNPTVEIKNLKKSFTLKPILRGINLRIQPSERIALLGANGTGKTTLLRTIAGLTQPDMGNVVISGFDSVRDAQQARSCIGFVAHQPYLYEELTALENLLFFARMYGVRHGRERAPMLLQRVGLERRIQERVSTFSRGQVQRLAWARALLHAPKVLLLDEPDTGLDEQGHDLIDTLLAEHTQSGGCTLFTTHQLQHALQLSDRIVILVAGRIVFQRKTATLDLETLRHIYQGAMP